MRFDRGFVLFLLVVFPVFLPHTHAAAQGVSPALDLDDSDLIDPNDVFLFASVWRQGAPSSRIFDIQDFFLITPGNYWHFSGSLDGDTQEDFGWTVEDVLEPVGGGQEAFRIQTDADDQDDQRHLDADLWSVAPNGDIFFHGIKEGEGFTLFFTYNVPPQTILLNTPIRFGGEGQRVGDVLEGSSTLQISAMTDSGPEILDATVIATVAYSAFLPTLDTVLGEFKIVLRVLLDIAIEVKLGESEFTIDFLNNTLFFKEGAGPVAVDLNPDVQNLDLKTIDEGTVVIDGIPTPIVPSKFRFPLGQSPKVMEVAPPFKRAKSKSPQSPR